MIFKRRTASSQPSIVAGLRPQAVLCDELGLYQRWYVELRTREELARGARVGTFFSIASWRLRLPPGEELSSELAKRAADAINAGLRTYDLPARIEQDLFGAILFDADYDAAATVAFRIKGDLQARAAAATRWQAGIATFPNDGVDADTLISTALRRLAEDALAA